MATAGAFYNSPEEGIEDMTALRSLTEDDLRLNIETRYFKDKIYVMPLFF